MQRAFRHLVHIALKRYLLVELSGLWSDVLLGESSGDGAKLGVLGGRVEELVRIARMYGARMELIGRNARTTS